ncbi:MAG: ion transporter [Methyloprofundus sp.]|nr:ion transporter [Methyloprofundus sp.]
MLAREKIKSIVNSSDSFAGKAFALTVQSLIVISLITFSIDTLPNLSLQTQNILSIIEWLTVGVFTLEYLLRLFVAENKLKFIFSFYGLIDLLAILPFYIAAGLDLRSIRIFRFLRLLRILKLFRYTQAISRLQRALIIVREELILFSFMSIALLYLSAVGIYYFENAAQPEKFQSIFHSLWWSVTTLTTVGYGDLHPVTVGGKIFTFFILIIGLGVVAIPTGLFASALSQVRLEAEKVDKP